MNASSPQPQRPRVRGFSLVELMVGIAVGLVGMLVVYKTLSIWDTSTRTTVAGGDAQTAGTLAMFNIERDIKLAGLGFGTATGTVMGCAVTGTDNKRGGKPLSFQMLPVQIMPGAASGPDSLKVLYGNPSVYVSEAAYTTAAATTNYLVQRDGFRTGDLAIVAGSGASAPCQLVQITDNTATDGHSVSHVNGGYTPDPLYAGASAPAVVARYNGAAAAPTALVGTMYNLGPAPSLSEWTVSLGGVLMRNNYLDSDSPVEVAAGVIDMRAEYGIGTTLGTLTWTTVDPTTDWSQVLAIRVALLVRSSQFEKSATGASGVPTTAVAPVWGASGVPFVMKNLSGGPSSHAPDDAVPDNWRYYRYRVYERVIPLRNMIWGQT